MPPIVVRAPPHASSGTLSLDIAERQILIHYPADAFVFHHRVLLIHLGDGRWLVWTPTGDIHPDDFANQHFLPIERATEFPGADRPFFCFGATTPEEITAARARAQAQAAILGVTVPAAPVGNTTDERWRWSDPSHADFGQEVPVAAMARPGQVVIRGASAMVEGRNPEGHTVWRFAERVEDRHVAMWIVDKREGAGRDQRLAASSAVRTQGRRPLFQDVAATLTRGTKASDVSDMFEGPSHVEELIDSMVASGVEPATFLSNLLQKLGVAPSSGLMKELVIHIHTLYYMLTIDRLNAPKLACAEHIARRVLQILRATKRSARAPNFEGLDEFEAHMKDWQGDLRTPAVDKHHAEKQRDQAQLMKQMRLAREEAAADEKRLKELEAAVPKAGKGGGKGKDGQ